MAIMEQVPVRESMRRVNDRMWESLARGGHDQPVPFFCECADEECYRAAWLTPAEYEDARRDTDWRALALGHVAAAPGA